MTRKDEQPTSKRTAEHAVALDETQLEQACGGGADFLLDLDGLEADSSGDRSTRVRKIEALTIKQK